MAGLAQAAEANEATQATPAPLPLAAIERQGYAFEFPRVLAQQRLFGIAHGVNLLAQACFDLPETADITRAAYQQWLDHEAPAIDRAQDELAHFYYGPRAAEATPLHLVRALNLRENLSFPTGSPALVAACKSLPEALQQPRYDLGALFRLEEAIAAATLAAKAEAQIAACTPRLDAEAQATLQTNAAEWQAAQTFKGALARTYILQNWEVARLAGDAESWLAVLSRRFSNPPVATCGRLAAWLLSPAAVLDNSFIIAPDPVPTSVPDLAEHGAPVVSAITLHAPVQEVPAEAPASSNAAVLTDPAPASVTSSVDTPKSSMPSLTDKPVGPRTMTRGSPDSLLEVLGITAKRHTETAAKPVSSGTAPHIENPAAVPVNVSPADKGITDTAASNRPLDVNSAVTPAEALANQNSAAVLNNPSPASATTVDPTEANEPVYPNLFELLMRLFDERADESTAHPGNPSARSPRAYP